MSDRTRKLAGLLLLATVAAGCVAINDENDDLIIPSPFVHQPAPTPVVASVPDIVIVDMHEVQASDPSLVRVVGTVVNHSTQDATRLTIRVEARDALGRALTRVNATTMAETVAAAGGSSTFEVSLPRSTAIHDYHAEVVAR